MKELANFLHSSNIVVTMTKKAKGFMIYNPESVTDLAKLTSLCNSVGFKVINSPAKFNAQTFYNNWKTISQKNKDLLKELFDGDEIKLIDEFANEIEKTFPKGFINASNTASALSRIIQQVGRGLFGIFGFKFANIQGLLVARGGFDRARDIISEKSAAKLVNKEFAPIFGTTASPNVNVAATIGANQILESNRIRNARQLPPSLASMYQRY